MNRHHVEELLLRVNDNNPAAPITMRTDTAPGRRCYYTLRVKGAEHRANDAREACAFLQGFIAGEQRGYDKYKSPTGM
jgi:hypothetical protein